MITPEQLAAPGTEHAHQKAVFQWITVFGSKRYPDMMLAHAIPNGSKLVGTGTARGQSEGAKMKAEGVRAGVPDIFVPVVIKYACAWPGLWIELKKPDRYTEKAKEGLRGRSEEQRDWQKGLIAQGYAVATAYGWMDAAHVLALYHAGNLRMPEGDDCIFAVGSIQPPW